MSKFYLKRTYVHLKVIIHYIHYSLLIKSVFYNVSSTCRAYNRIGVCCGPADFTCHISALK